LEQSSKYVSRKSRHYWQLINPGKWSANMIVAFEVVITLIFLGLLVWSVKYGSTACLGSLLGGYFLSGFDWLWCTAGFWNATFNSELTMIPGLNIQGITYPYTIGFLWAIGFGLLPLIVSKYYETLRMYLGRLHFPVIFAGAVLTDMVVEIICVHWLGLWTYHQSPEFLLFSWNWSNAWFLGGILTASYYGMAYARKWGVLSDAAGFSLSSETIWKGLFVPTALILTPAAIITPLQLFWFSAMTPWITSGRPF